MENMTLHLLVFWKNNPGVTKKDKFYPLNTNVTFQEGYPVRIKAGTDYGTYSAAQPDSAAKNMMFASVDSQQTCCEHATNMFQGRAVLPRN